MMHTGKIKQIMQDL